MVGITSNILVDTQILGSLLFIFPCKELSSVFQGQLLGVFITDNTSL